MPRRRAVIGKLFALAVLTIGSALVGLATTEARRLGDIQSQVPGGRLPLEPLGVRGEAVFPALEGWYPNQDGTFTILLGYFNRNSEQILDIPVGPNNRIEPGGPDRGQPTHFLPRRQYGVFSITVPKDFGKQRLTWTLVANGHTSTVSFWLNPPYLVEPFKNLANGNTPPVIRFPGTSDMQGPPRAVAQTLRTKASEPVTLSVDVVDKPPTYVPPPSPAAAARGRGRGGPPPLVTISWTKFRGPGTITFSQARQEFSTLDGTATTAATFSEPGEYMIRATANDSSGDGGGGDQCCWTTALVKVTVEP
jgi:hypothetical protein